VEEPTFIVFVDDNFSYAAEHNRYMHGCFPTSEAAIDAAKRLVDDSLRRALTPGMTAEELYRSYTADGEDPFIVAQGAERVHFSAWEYAERRCYELCPSGHRTLGQSSKPTDRAMTHDEFMKALSKAKGAYPSSDKDSAGWIITGVTTKPKPQDKKD
jgi:hypothetical protein